MTYEDTMSEYINDMKYSRALPAMQEAAKEQVDQHIIDQTPEWFESIGPDAWSEIALTHLWRACYHRDAAAVGQVLLASMDQYLYTHCWEQIRDEWEEYVDG
jgi:hypothetical protein